MLGSLVYYQASCQNNPKRCRLCKLFFSLEARIAMQGIKITDADSKKKAIKILKAEQAMREMDIDSDASDSGSDIEMK